MTLPALLVQLLNGLASAASLFLVAAGLTLIFGVTRVINFAHGSLYMLGAYLAYSLGAAFGIAFGASAAAFFVAAFCAALIVSVLGAVVERTILRRLYGAPELLQLTATFALVLVLRDAVLALWGAEDRLGPRVPGLAGVVEVYGQAIPQYDLLLIVIAPLVFAVMTLVIARTRFGMVLRAAAENRTLTQALGIDQKNLFTLVFALGSFLAGAAGALALPRQPANLGMDLSVVADAFVVTVVGGLGSIPGALLAAIVIGVAKALCIAVGTVNVAGLDVAFPKLTLIVEFLVMAIVLMLRPYGLLGHAPVVPATTPLPEQRALVLSPGRREAWVAIVVLLIALMLPLIRDPYALVLATDILIAALFTASLQLMTGMGGMASFGHAAFFGIGAYAAAVTLRSGWPFALALTTAPLFTLLIAASIGAVLVRLSGVYLAMLTLAFAQIAWSIAFQWDAVTGGSNGIVGAWPPAPLSARTPYYYLVLTISSAALFALARIAYAPFGYALRGARDAPMRAEALGIAVAWRRFGAFTLSAAFAGLAGALFAFAKGSVSPETLAIPRSVDVLVMMLLGGLNALFGPLLGAAAFVWMQDALARATDYWRACVGAGILILVLVFPQGLGGALDRLLASVRRTR
ncbi:MAG TPA: ABC transporter permease [Casimicrobiaceae bacterium]|nr:ABC transporter permease [Casimicrobiaceae bacterium]